MRNFTSLSDIEFEKLCADLLARELGLHVEHFPAGRDRGIDLRWHPGTATAGIGQCKHYVKTPYSGLLKAAKEEVVKVKKLNPSRYLFITSQDLTVGQKDELFKLFSQWMTSTADVYSGRDIDALISKYPDVEREHVKLWLNSGSELFNIVHAGLVNRSKHLAERAAEEMNVFVYTENFDKAKQILLENRVCIIAGAPGVGKTTLAHALIMDSIREGFVPVSVSKDVEEASNLFDLNRKQIFMYDDFLGEISGKEKFEKNEDKELLYFLERVENSADHLFILTTREYILREAQDRYTELGEINPSSHITLALPSYTHEVKAQILYNHVWHSSLPEALRKQFSSGGWKSIVEHKGFNPRLIKYATGKLLIGAEESYISEFKKILDNPVKLWKEAYDHHLNDIQKTVLRVLCTYDRARLKQVVTNTISLLQHELVLNQREIETQLNFIDQTFIRIDLLADIHMIGFDSPTVREFMHSVIKDDQYILAALVENASELSQLWVLASASFTQLNSLFVYGSSADEVSELNLGLVAEQFQRATIRLFAEEHRNDLLGAREYSLSTLTKIPAFLHPPKDWWVKQLELIKESWRKGIGNLQDLVPLLSSEALSEIVVEDQDSTFASLSVLLGKVEVNSAADWEAWINIYSDILREDLPETAADDFEDHIGNIISTLESSSSSEVDEYLDIAHQFGCDEAIRMLEEVQVRIDHEEGFRDNGYYRNTGAVQRLLSDTQINQMFDRFS